MNCDEARKRMLLADSGELPASELVETEEHISSCADCRRHKNFVGRIVSDGRACLSAREPSAAVIALVKAIAERERRGGARYPFSAPLLQALSYAAAVGLIIGGWFLLATDPPQRAVVAGHAAKMDPAENMSHLHAIVSLLSEQELAEGDSRNGPDIDQQRVLLARRLLVIEGFADENPAELEDAEESETEPLSIDPLSSNTSARHRKICA